MKKTLFAALLALACASTAKSQTKGTNAIGLGFGAGSSKQESTTFNNYESKGASGNISYGYFLKDNFKLAVVAAHSYTKSGYDGGTNDKTNLWAGGFNLNHYYPLGKKFYATVGAGPTYNYVKSSQVKVNSFDLSAFGGLSYFVNKHFVLETTLLSASASYTHQKSKDNNSTNSGTTISKSVGASTSGEVTNLNFRINFLF